MTNPFEAHAERQMNGAQRAKIRRDERTEARREERTRPPSPLQKKMAEQAELLKLYRAWRRGIREEVARTHAANFKNLIRLIRNLHWDSAPAVVQFVQDARWLQETDEDTKFITLDLIDASLARARVRYGLPHADDGFLDEEPGPFIKIRRAMIGY